jgi:hypothetical protein
MMDPRSGGTLGAATSDGSTSASNGAGWATSIGDSLDGISDRSIMDGLTTNVLVHLPREIFLNKTISNLPGTRLWGSNGVPLGFPHTQRLVYLLVACLLIMPMQLYTTRETPWPRQCSWSHDLPHDRSARNRFPWRTKKHTHNQTHHIAYVEEEALPKRWPAVPDEFERWP